MRECPQEKAMRRDREAGSGASVRARWPQPGHLPPADVPQVGSLHPPQAHGLRCFPRSGQASTDPACAAALKQGRADPSSASPSLSVALCGRAGAQHPTGPDSAPGCPCSGKHAGTVSHKERTGLSDQPVRPGCGPDGASPGRAQKRSPFAWKVPAMQHMRQRPQQQVPLAGHSQPGIRAMGPLPAKPSGDGFPASPSFRRCLQTWASLVLWLCLLSLHLGPSLFQTDLSRVLAWLRLQRLFFQTSVEVAVWTDLFCTVQATTRVPRVRAVFRELAIALRCPER